MAFETLILCADHHDHIYPQSFSVFQAETLHPLNTNTLPHAHPW